MDLLRIAILFCGVYVGVINCQSLRLEKGSEGYKIYKKIERRLSKLQKVLENEVREVRDEVVKSYDSLDNVLDTVKVIESEIKSRPVVPGRPDETHGGKEATTLAPTTNINTKMVTTTTPKPRKPFIERHPKLAGVFSACLSSEANCFLFDSIFVDAGKAIVVTDYRNEKVKKFSLDGVRLGELRLSRRQRPQGLSPINATHFAVGAPLDKTILIISSSNMEIVDRIRLPDGCGYGLAITHDNKIVASCRSTRPPSVRIYDMEGTLEKTIDTDGRENYFKSPMHVAAGKEPNHIYVSDVRTKRVSSINRSGHLHFVHRGSTGSGTFFGLTVDPDGDIYVTDKQNQRVEHIKPNGDFVRHLIGTHDSVPKPISIHVTDEGKLLLVGQLGDVKIFDML